MRKSALVSLGVLITLVFAVNDSLQAGEIIYADDIRTNVITSQSLVRTTDNIIVLVDTSGSMSTDDIRACFAYAHLLVGQERIERLPMDAA